MSNPIVTLTHLYQIFVVYVPYFLSHFWSHRPPMASSVFSIFSCPCLGCHVSAMSSSGNSSSRPVATRLLVHLSRRNYHFQVPISGPILSLTRVKSAINEIWASTGQCLPLNLAISKNSKAILNI